MIIRERLPVSTPAVELPEPWRSAAVTVVLPTYNEAANLPAVAAALFALPLPGLRILVADDNSPDGTGDIADQLADRYGAAKMTVAHRPAKQGLGRAYVDGMTRALQADADFVVQMDSDLSHAPEYLPEMLGTLLATNADVVIGSRYVAGASLAQEWAWHRKALSGFANMYVRMLLRLGIRDVTAGFKLWRSSALATMEIASIQSNGYSFQVEMNYRAVQRGLKIVELPIHFAERREGQSKMSLRVQLESALMPFQLRRPAKSISRSAKSATWLAGSFPDPWLGRRVSTQPEGVLPGGRNDRRGGQTPDGADPQALCWPLALVVKPVNQWPFDVSEAQGTRGGSLSLDTSSGSLPLTSRFVMQRLRGSLFGSACSLIGSGWLGGSLGGGGVWGLQLAVI